MYNSMPILEDGLSSGNMSEVEDNCDMDVDQASNGNNSSYNDQPRQKVPENLTVELMKKQINEIEQQIVARNSYKPESLRPAQDEPDYVDIETFLHERDSNGNDCRLGSHDACNVNQEFLRTLGKTC